jgi:hypothetical protein
MTCLYTTGIVSFSKLNRFERGMLLAGSIGTQYRLAKRVREWLDHAKELRAIDQIEVSRLCLQSAQLQLKLLHNEISSHKVAVTIQNLRINKREHN